MPEKNESNDKSGKTWSARDVINPDRDPAGKTWRVDRTEVIEEEGEEREFEMVVVRTGGNLEVTFRQVGGQPFPKHIEELIQSEGGRNPILINLKELKQNPNYQREHQQVREYLELAFGDAPETKELKELADVRLPALIERIPDIDDTERNPKLEEIEELGRELHEIIKEAGQKSFLVSFASTSTERKEARGEFDSLLKAHRYKLGIQDRNARGGFLTDEHEGQYRVYLDPNFAKELGIDAPDVPDEQRDALKTFISRSLAANRRINEWRRKLGGTSGEEVKRLQDELSQHQAELQEKERLLQELTGKLTEEKERNRKRMPDSSDPLVREVFAYTEPGSKYEMPRGDQMDPVQYAALLDIIEQSRERLRDALLDQWIIDHKQEVLARFGRTELPLVERKLLEKEGDVKEMLKNSRELRTLSALHRSMRESQGRPTVRAGLISFALLADRQEALAHKFSTAPDSEAFSYEQNRILKIQEALYRSIYKKEALIDQERLLQEIMQDPKIDQAYQASLARANRPEFITMQKDYPNTFEPWEFAVLKGKGYKVEPKGKWKLLKFMGLKIVKDGREVSTEEIKRILMSFEREEKRRLAKRLLEGEIQKKKVEFFGTQVLKDVGSLEQLSEDMERDEMAQLGLKNELIKRKERNLDEGREYHRMYEERGENVLEFVSTILPGGQYEEFYEKFKGTKEEEFATFLRYTHQPESYMDRLTKKQKKDFLKKLKEARKVGYFEWLKAVMDISIDLEKL